MQISVDQLQQSTKGIQTKKKDILVEQDVEFQDIMLQIMSMLNMNEHQDNEGMVRGLDKQNIVNNEELKSIPMENQELFQIIEDIISTQSNLLDKNQPIKTMNTQSNGEPSIMSEKMADTPLEKILTELKAVVSPSDNNEGEKVETLDLSRINRIISFSQQKTESGKEEIKPVSAKEILMEEEIKGIERTLADKVETKNLGTNIETKKIEITQESITKNLTRKLGTKEQETKKSETKEISLNNQTLSFTKNLDTVQRPQQQLEVQNMQEVVKEMIEEISVLKDGEQTNLQVKLKPKELGKIEIKLEMKAGEVVGKILVESMSAKGALDNQLQHLKVQLKSQNIVIQEVEVNLQQHNQGDSQERRQTFFFNDDASSNFNSGKAYEGDEVDEKMGYARKPLMKLYSNGGRGSALNFLA